MNLVAYSVLSATGVRRYYDETEYGTLEMALGAAEADAASEKTSAVPVYAPVNAEDEASLIPAGWVFLSADFSSVAKRASNAGTVTLTRDYAGTQRWASLTKAEQEDHPLFIRGYGATISEAICKAIPHIKRQLPLPARKAIK